MAVTATAQKIVAYADLNNGTGPSGAIKTVGLNIAGGTTQQIDMDVFASNPTTTREGIVAIVSALSPVLSKSLYNLREVDTYKLQIE